MYFSHKFCSFFSEDVLSVYFLTIIYLYFYISFSILSNAHFPDNKPTGRQQQTNFKILVKRNVHWGIPFPNSFVAISLEKWLQLLSNKWYFPHVYLADSSSIICYSYSPATSISPKNNFWLNINSALSGSMAITPVWFESESHTK